MRKATITLEEYIALPDYLREFSRRFRKLKGGGEFPPENEIPPPVEVSTLTKAPKESCVYFIQAESGPIKIGVATNVRKRLSMLQTGNHEALELLCSVQGGVNFETQLHNKFRKHSIRGEWFEPHEDILAEIARLTPPEMKEN